MTSEKPSASSTSKLKPEDIDDFDEILEEALHDFDDPNLLKPAFSKAQAQASIPKAAEQMKKEAIRENLSEDDLLRQLESLDFSGLSDENLTEENMQDFMSKLTKDFSSLDSTVKTMLEPTEEDENDPELKKIKDELRKLSEKVDEVPEDSTGVKELGLTLAQTLKTLNESIDKQGSGDSAAAAASGSSEENMFPFMENLMQTLLSKDLIYPSLKSVRDNYPKWIEEHADGLSEADQNKYYTQLDIVRQVCHEYETLEEGVSPSQEKFVTILELMQKMQELGPPPEELVGDEDLPNSLPQCPQM